MDLCSPDADQDRGREGLGPHTEGEGGGWAYILKGRVWAYTPYHIAIVDCTLVRSLQSPQENATNQTKDLLVENQLHLPLDFIKVTMSKKKSTKQMAKLSVGQPISVSLYSMGDQYSSLIIR